MMRNQYSPKTISLFRCNQIFLVLLMLLLPSKAILGQDLTINATFVNNNPAQANNITAAQQAVIQQAINEWHAIITSRGINPANYPITFQNGGLAGNNLAVTNIRFNTNSGAVISAVVTFDNTNRNWYIDLTPGNLTDDNIPTGPCPPGPCPQFDYLSVARHEIGHALGFIIPLTTPPANQTSSPAVNPFVNAAFTTFDASRLNMGVVVANPGGGHTVAAAHPNDIMNPQIPAGVQRTISLYPAASFIARAYQCDITMNFIDRANTGGNRRGSATDPWNTVMEWRLFAGGRGALLLIPGTYTVPVPFIQNIPATIDAARGGSAVIKK